MKQLSIFKELIIAIAGMMNCCANRYCLALGYWQSSLVLKYSGWY